MLKNISLILVSILIGFMFGGLFGYTSGKCDGINWMAKEHSLAAQCK